MRLFLIRHAETEHNIAGLLAGSTNSRLTTHGVTQTYLLATHLVQTRGLRFTHIVSSDQQRARLTAAAIAAEAEVVRAAEAKDRGSRAIKAEAKTKPDAQTKTEVDAEAEVEAQAELQAPSLRVWTDPRLREKCFGERELQPWAGGGGKPKAPLRAISTTETPVPPAESDDAVRERVESFVQEVLLPLAKPSPLLRDQSIADAPLPLPAQGPETTVALVSHGITLRHIYASLLRISGGAGDLVLPSDLTDKGGNQSGRRGGKDGGEWAETQRSRIRGGWVPAWSNTGFVEVDLSPCLRPTEEEEEEVDEDGLVRRSSIENGISLEKEDWESTGQEISRSSPELLRLSASTSLSSTVAVIGPSSVASPTSSIPKLRLTLHAVNCTAHLATLKRTRGGVGSAVWDGKQRTLEGMFGGGGGKRVRKM